MRSYNDDVVVWYFDDDGDYDEDDGDDDDRGNNDHGDDDGDGDNMTKVAHRSGSQHSKDTQPSSNP